MTWTSDERPPEAEIALSAWPRVALRATTLAVLIFGGLGVHLLLRLPEYLAFGPKRPVTPWLTQAVCRGALAIMRLSVQIDGQPLRDRGALVANHASWLDIFVLNAAARVFFVSKAEVAGWPGIGWLARATGTVFIRRDWREAASHAATLEARLHAGHKLLFFPEGTSSDAQRVLPFKTTLFAAFLTPELRDFLSVQPVSVVYQVPDGGDPRSLAWWGDMAFGPHLLRVLARPRAGRVRLIFHASLRVADMPDRKALALACETAVREGFESVRKSSPADERCPRPM